MKFELQKNEKFVIQKAITKVSVGLGWDTGFDLDAHAFGCVIQNGSPKFYNDGSHAVTYANPSLKKSGKAFGANDDSIISSGDDRTGASSAGGDDEVIKIDFEKVPAQIEEISIWVTIHEALEKGLNFSKVKDAYVRVINEDSGQELCRYNLTREHDTAVSVQVGSLVKANNSWSFVAVGAGMADKGLGDILDILS